ncbi:MAG: hypothetical protein RLY32_1548 [Pseudomonadota bacterium]
MPLKCFAPSSFKTPLKCFGQVFWSIDQAIRLDKQIFNLSIAPVQSIVFIYLIGITYKTPIYELFLLTGKVSFK